MAIRENEGRPSNNATHSITFEDYDLVILGDGTGATLAAWTFASQGQRVAVIERRYIGGSCPNVTCLPEQEHYSECEGGVLLSSRQGVQSTSQTVSRVDMPEVRGSKARDGIGLEQYVSR